MPRGRPKKINILETDDDTETQVEAKPARGFKKSVTHIERYTEPVEPEQLEILPETQESQFEPAKHPFDVVLDDFGASGGSEYIKVYKLPEYAKTGVKNNRHVVREFCANIPVTPDYENVIKESWGGGHYQLDLRHGDGSFAAGKYITIANPAFSGPGPARNGNNPTTVNSAAGNGISYEIPDPMVQMNATLDLIAKMRRSFGGEMNLQPPVQSPPSPPLTTESALLHLVSQDSEVIDQFTGSLKRLLKRGDSGGHETTWLDLVDSAIKADLIPKTLDRAKSLLLEVIGAKNGVSTTPPQSPQPVPVQTQGRSPAVNGLAQVQNSGGTEATGSVSADNQHTETIGTEQAIVARTLQTLLSACEAYPLHLQNCDDPDCKQMDHFGGPASWIMNEEKAYPFLGDLINLVIQLPVDQITIWINSQPGGQAYTALPHWSGWITGLQKLLKDSTEEEPEEPTS